MKPQLNTRELILKIAKSIGVLFCSLIFVAVLHPDVRSQVRGLVHHDSRQILSTASADFAGDGSQFKIVKVRTDQSLYLEFYKVAQDGTSKLFQKINMQDKKDGYFNYNGRATNLVVDQMGNDKSLKILAPSFDKDLVAHLNVFAFDPATQQFIRADHPN